MVQLTNPILGAFASVTLANMTACVPDPELEYAQATDFAEDYSERGQLHAPVVTVMGDANPGNLLVRGVNHRNSLYMAPSTASPSASTGTGTRTPA